MRRPSARSPAGRRSSRGLTWIELLVFLVALGVVLALALSSVRQIRVRQQRSDATRGLARIQAQEERCLVEQSVYCELLEALPPRGLGLGRVSKRGYFEYELKLGPGARSWRARALPRPGRDALPDPHCRVYALDQNGLRQAWDERGADSSRDCWP